jgi:hypothetical protein
VYEERQGQDGVRVALPGDVNVAGVSQVQPSSSSAQHAGSASIFSSPAPAGGLGAFLSLLGDVIAKGQALPLAGLLEQQAVDLAGTNGASVARKPKGKDAKGGEKNANEEKSDEAKSKVALVQIAPEHPQAIIKPLLIIFGAATAQPQAESTTTSHSGLHPDEASQAGEATLSVSIPVSSRASAPQAAVNEPVPTGQIAFGLRLTPSTPETKVTARSSGSQTQTSPLERPSPPATTGEILNVDKGSPQISALHAIDAEKPQLNPELPVHVPDPSLTANPAQSRVETESEAKPAAEASPVLFSDTGRVAARPQVASSPAGPIEQVRAGQMVPAAARLVLGSNRDAILAPDKTSEVAASRESASEPAPNLRSITATIGGREAVSETASAQQSTTPGVVGNNATSENNSMVANADDREAAAGHAPIPERVVSPKPQQPKPTQESDNGEPAPKVIRPQAGEKQDAAVANRNAGQGNQRAPESQAQPMQGPKMLDTRTERSAADPTQTTKVATEPEINTAARPQPARQISLKLTGADSAKVDVELTNKAGKVQVAVRTSDQELAKSLQTDLGDLVGRLENKGFKTEAWVPTASRHSSAAVVEQSSSANSQGDSRHSGSGSGQQQGRQGQNGSNQRQQARWKAHLEETLSVQETRMETND